MPVTPITPAQIDEVGKGASASPPGHSRAEPSGLGPTAECPSRGPAASTGPIGWAWEYHCGGGEWSPTISDFRPSDASWRRNIRPLYDHLPAFAAAKPWGGYFDSLDDEGQQLVLNAMQERACEVSNTTYFDDYQQAEMFKAGLEELARQLALGTEAEGQDAASGLVHEGPADLSATPEATPSIPPPSPRKGQEENPCPMTVEEAREVLDQETLGGRTPWAQIKFLGLLAAQYAATTTEQKHYRTRASRIEIALSTIRASEEDR